jgi:effector-binding domain-containing protein
MALFIAGAYFLPRIAVVERSAIIESSAKVVFAQVNDLHSWEKWSKWNQIDPEMKIDFINNGVGENAGYRWSSNNKNVGSGELFIVESVPYDSIAIQISFSEQGDARSVFTFVEQDSSTSVNWKMEYDVGFNPAARWFGLMIGKYVGPDFKEGLENLNVVCKVQVQENSLIEELVNLKQFNYAGIRKEVPFVEVSLIMGEMYAEVSNFIEANNVGIAGTPFAIYHEMEGERIDLECGIPITELTEGNEIIKTAVYPESKCAVVDYYGDYRLLEDAHTALQSWIEERRFKLAGSPLEFYFTDPANESKPENWHTRIMYPVR